VRDRLKDGDEVNIYQTNQGKAYTGGDTLIDDEVIT
jgi:hypothetical protein